MEDFEKQLQAQINKIEHEKNKEIVIKLVNEGKSNNLSVRTLVMKTHYVGLLSNRFNIDFSDITREDLSTFIKECAEGSEYQNKLAPGTLSTLKANIKGFYVWLEGNGNNTPDKVNWIKQHKTRKDLSVEDLLSFEDITLMVKNCRTKRDMAILILLFDSGFRASEFMGLRIQDVSFKENGLVMLKVTKSKTYKRTIPVKRSSIFLKQYLETEHPCQDNPNAPLFFKSKSKKTKENSITIDEKDLINIVRYAGIKAKINRTVYPHLFRHSRATETARNGMQEAKMRWFFGWSETSSMPSHYTHLASSDISDYIQNEFEDSENKPIIPIESCPICGVDNPISNAYCYRCNQPMSEEQRNILQEKEDQINFLLEQNKEMMEKFEQVKELVKTAIAFVDEFEDEEKNTVFISQAGNEKLRTREWYQENWNVDPDKVNVKYFEVKNRKDRTGAPMKLWLESDVLPFSNEYVCEKMKLKNE